MTDLLAQVLGLTQAWLLAGTLVFLRVGAAFLVLPAIGEAYIPMRIRLGAALAMTLLLTPALAADLVPDSGNPDRYAGHFATEPVAGLLLGLAVRLVAMALQIAGSMAAQATSLSQIAGGASPDPQPAIGAFLTLAGLTLAVMAGLHVLVARLLIESYQVLPAGQMPLAGDVAGWGVARVGRVFSLAFSLAAPFLIASVLYNLALGVINKAMPQLMVAFVGAPAITLGGLVILLLTTPFILPAWMRLMQATLASPMGPLP
ncbi:MAG: flagellar biosynthesis protein FliR [Rhodobacteraceae bacterium CG17_big_fil_post_rev_8_21_14_2_50_65_11]|nr:MAG: flagellar biosynthesis protein FliR [Rhodobacteraceae bacterium CG17_big_fil_post_rev_8_21_14_2_50_65_11]